VSDSNQGAETPRRRVRRPWYSAWIPPKVIESSVVDTRGGSLVASAARIVTAKLRGSSHRKTEGWMAEAWTMYDLVGELHFLSSTLARRASRARFYVGKVAGSDVVELPVALSEDASKESQAAFKREKKVRDVFDSLGDGFIGMQELVERVFLNQFVVGMAYMVGAPSEVWKGQGNRDINVVPVNDLEWRALSVMEFTQTAGGYELNQGGAASGTDNPKLKLNGSHVYVISLWTPHPSNSTIPDSPVRAALPILRELVGLTQHVSAQIDSRLAGAGLLVMRSSASRAIKRSFGIPEDDQRDVFTEMLLDAMVTPISDRDSASAVVPLVVTIPDESQAPEYISFDAPLDQYAAPLREEAIRRIALSLDAPPELLLGQGSTSHWTAWLTQEEVVDSHISPTLGMIVRGLTIEFLRPILRANGFTEEEAESYAIWYDTSDLTVKANIAQDSRDLYALDLLSDDTVRRANGFDESDAPKRADVKDQAIDLVKSMVEGNPGLMNRPGLDVLVTQIEALLNGQPKTGLTASKAAKASSGAAEIPEIEEEAVPESEAPASNAAGGPRPPVTTVSTPGLPQTRAGAAAETETFGTWDK